MSEYNKIKNPETGSSEKETPLQKLLREQQEFKKLNLSIKDIINNPTNHFYFNGMKVLSIHILKKFKYNRTTNIVDGQKNIRIKDINDYNMLVKFLKS